MKKKLYMTPDACEAKLLGMEFIAQSGGDDGFVASGEDADPITGFWD